MARTTRFVWVTASILTLASLCIAQHGPTPRPAEKPPEYGCRLLDLTTTPNVVRDGDRIDAFLLKYTCPEKTRPVDVEVSNEQVPGSPPELVKVATDLVLEKGEHTLRLGGGGLAQGGRYITVLKARVPEGKKEILRHVDPAVCKGWELEYVEKALHVSGCSINLRTDPQPFRTGERIDAFILGTKCDKPHKGIDIKVSWESPTHGQRELVKVATDVFMPAGSNTMKLLGGGVGRQGFYILEIQTINLGSYFKTSCTAWTMSGT